MMNCENQDFWNLSSATVVLVLRNAALPLSVRGGGHWEQTGDRAVLLTDFQAHSARVVSYRPIHVDGEAAAAFRNEGTSSYVNHLPLFEGFAAVWACGGTYHDPPRGAGLDCFDMTVLCSPDNEMDRTSEHESCCRPHNPCAHQTHRLRSVPKQWSTSRFVISPSLAPVILVPARIGQRGGLGGVLEIYRDAMLGIGSCRWGMCGFSGCETTQTLVVTHVRQWQPYYSNNASVRGARYGSVHTYEVLYGVA